MFMNKLRKQTKYFLWVVVFGFVMWIAFDLGANLVLKKKARPWQKGIIAKIDGRDIPYRVFEARYQKVLKDTMHALGDRTLSYEEEKGVKESVWKDMLTALRYNELMKKRKLRFDDNFYLTLMQSIPPQELLQDTTFRDSTGKFDINKYRQALANPQNAAYFINYEYKLRNEIIPREINAIDIYYALDMGEAEFKVFMSPEFERRKCKYFLIKPFDIPDSLVSINDNDLISYYDSHRDKFKIPKQFSLFVVNFPLKPSSNDTIDAAEKLKDILFSISQGDTFENLAKDMSDDPSAQNGGDIGWIRDSGKYAFLYKIAQKSPLDSVIGPIEHGKSLYLLKKVKEKKDSIHIKIIKSDIKLQDQTVYDIRESANNFAEMVKKENFKEFAKENGYKVIETGYFKENSAFARGIGLLRGEIKDIIKDAKKGRVYGPVKVEGSFVVFKVIDIKEPYVMPFDSVKTVVKKQVKWEKKIEKAKELVEKARAVVSTSPDSLNSWTLAKNTVRPINATVSETSPFTLFGFVDYNVGYSSKFKAVAFSIKKKELSSVETDERVGAFFIYVEDIISSKNLNPFVINMQKSRILQSIFSQGLMSELAGTTGVKDYREYFLAN